MPIARYRLGCPMWGETTWLGTLYRQGTRAERFLAEYAGVFNAVEGNTTFYSEPAPATVARWRDDVGEDFRFALKLPRAITHERLLAGARAATEAFVALVAPLGPRLGPFLVQLPPAFGPEHLDRLGLFLAELPLGWRWAVELRHPAFFDDGALQQQVDALLAFHGVERALLDTRPLRAGDPRHPEVAGMRQTKPDLPVAPRALTETPFVRLIGHPDPEPNAPWLETWADQVARWIADGRTPYVFVHVAHNRHAPALARGFHAALGRRVDVGALPAFPGETGPRQLTLLD